MLWGVVSLLSFFILAGSFLFFYQDKIIQLFISEANKHIATKVEVKQISLSFIDKFPQVSVKLDQVRVIESLPNSDKRLADLKKIYCTFSLYDIWRKNYKVKELFLEEGEVKINVLPNGERNYNIFKKSTPANANEAFAFQLEKIILKKVAVSYSDQRLKQFYEIVAQDWVAALNVQPDNIEINTTGNTWVEKVLIDKNNYFSHKQIYLNTQLVINPTGKSIRIAPSLIQIGKADYQVNGTIDYASITKLNLDFSGKNTTVQSILALLPQKYNKPFSQYQSNGVVYFNGKINGLMDGKQNPLVTIDFGAKQASFYHPQYKQKLRNINLKGFFTNGARRNASTSEITLKDISGTLENRAFAGNLIYSNFNDPGIKLNLKADIDLAHFFGLFPMEEVKRANGLANVAINLSAKISALKSSTHRTGITASGDVTLHQVGLQLKKHQQPFHQLNGTFLIRKNDVAVTNFTGFLGSSDFKLNGYFKNMLGWTFLKKQQLFIEADLQSRFVNFDELLSSTVEKNGAGVAKAPGKPASKSKAYNDYRLVLSPYFDFNINAHIGKMRFRRFTGTNARGQVRLKDQIVSSPHISLQVMGGKFGIQGNLDARSANRIKVNTKARLDQIQVDSLFYVFENFGQNFIVQRHLKGELTATVDSDLYFDNQLNAITDKMEAEVKATIRNGQLINFEPMQKLSVFAHRRELANIRFSELSNSIFIQSRTVYIPEMEIRSNVSRVPVIGIQGTHTFDQQMDYKFRIPLTMGKARGQHEGYGSLTGTNTGTPNLFLTLKGNETNYKFAFDKERVKNKIVQDLKREKQIVTNILRGKKTEEKKEVQLEEDEYFNF